jgi:GntR family transcriptional regulator, histidine utilization repressor
VTLRSKGKPIAPYEKVKRHIMARIESGEWSEGTRLPSEHELVESLGVSRMTIHRALRELSTEGLLSRIQGVGTFLLPPPTRSEAFKVQEIDDEIVSRAHRHRAKIVSLEAIDSSADLAEGFGMRPGSKIFHSVLVHYEDDVPVQLEERHVSPAVAPDYLNQDFTSRSPGKYLLSLGHPSEIDHVVYAIAPDKRTQKLLTIDANEPCLLLVRRAFGQGGSAHSKSRFTYPGSRYSLGSHYKVSEEGERRVFLASSER